MRRLIVLSLVALAACSSPAPPPEPAARPRATEERNPPRLLDLTYALGPGTIFWPTEPAFERKDTTRGKTPGGWFYAAGHFSSAEHGGTHVDAPVHFSEKGASIDELSPARFHAKVWVLDARRACAKDPDHLVSIADFDALDRASALPEGAIVLVLTGWGRYWPDRKAYLGDDRPGHVDALSFPGLDPELAKKLVARRPSAIAIDTASIDRGKSTTFEAHRVLALANVPVVENVANADAIQTGDWVIVAPMNIEGATGAPARVLGVTAGPRRVRIEAGERAGEVAEALSRLAPTEAEVSRDGTTVKGEIAATFLGDDRRLAWLTAALERAAFRVRFALEDGDPAWKAPPWPARAHGPGGHREHHDFERGTNEERIARYEDPARDAWQKPDEVVKALAIKDGDVVADLGVGSGYFAMRLARAYPRARVVGLDIEPGFVEHVLARAKKEGLANLEARVVKPDDPELAPASVDVVLIVDVYHHLPDRVAYLAKLRAGLRKGGRIAILDFKKDSTHGPEGHKLAKEVVLAEAEKAGLKLGKEHAFLPEQYFIELVAR